MITVKYTLEELQVLTKLMDIAVRQGGLQIAGDAFLLHQKHSISLQMHQDETQTKSDYIECEADGLNELDVN